MIVEHVMVTWSVSLCDLKIPDNLSEEEQRDYICEKAKESFEDGEYSGPVIHDCSDTNLID